MISEFFLNIVFNIVQYFFGIMPAISWDVNTSAFSYFLNIIRVVSYMFPWYTVSAIFSLVVAFTLFRIVISFLKSIWDILPLV